MSDSNHLDRHDPEFTETASAWAEEGCLPETSDTETEIARLQQIVKGTPENRRQDVVDLIAARALMAREDKKMAEDICARVLDVLGVEDSEESKSRLLRLVQNG